MTKAFVKEVNQLPGETELSRAKFLLLAITLKIYT